MQFVFSKIVLKTLQWCWWRWTCVFEAIPFNSAELLFLILTNFCYLGPFFNCSFQRSIKNILYIASVAGILIFKVFYPKNLCIINKYISISQIHLMIILMLVCQKQKKNHKRKYDRQQQRMKEEGVTEVQFSRYNIRFLRKYWNIVQVVFRRSLGERWVGFHSSTVLCRALWHNNMDNEAGC